MIKLAGFRANDHELQSNSTMIYWFIMNNDDYRRRFNSAVFESGNDDDVDWIDEIVSKMSV